MDDFTEVGIIWQWFCPHTSPFNLWIVTNFRYSRGYERKKISFLRKREYCVGDLFVVNSSENFVDKFEMKLGMQIKDS